MASEIQNVQKQLKKMVKNKDWTVNHYAVSAKKNEDKRENGVAKERKLTTIARHPGMDRCYCITRIKSIIA